MEKTFPKCSHGTHVRTIYHEQIFHCGRRFSRPIYPKFRTRPEPGYARVSGVGKSRIHSLAAVNLCWPIFGRFPAKLGPKTLPDESGSKNDAERTVKTKI